MIAWICSCLSRADCSARLASVMSSSTPWNCSLPSGPMKVVASSRTQNGTDRARTPVTVTCRAEVYSLRLRDALPIWPLGALGLGDVGQHALARQVAGRAHEGGGVGAE